MLAYLLAAVAGVATILSPCILPVLPIVLAATAGRSRVEALLIIVGFVATFASGGILIGALSASSGALPQAIRTGSILFLLVAGMVCLWPAPFEWLVQRVRALIGPRIPGRPRPTFAVGKAGAFLVGVSLGFAWAPCAGPILASILALAAGSQAPGRATVLLGAYALGAGLPMLGIAYGGDRVASRLAFFKRRTNFFRKGFGAVAIGFALLQLLQYDVLFTAWATQWFPSISTEL